MVTRALPLAVLLLAACAPELPDTLSQVTGPSLLAVASLPAEGAPPASVSYQALYVAPPGTELPASGLSWAFCTARLALTDDGTVSPSCIAPSGSALLPIGDGLSATAALPMDACRDFGPDVPVTVGNQPPGRPVDPDPTGGYYQPVRLEVPPAASGAPPTYVIGSTRIDCGLAGATATLSAEFDQEYRNNQNPAVASLTLVQSSGDTPLPPGAAPGARVPAGASVTLRAAWAACPTEPVCGDGICGIDETSTSCPADCTQPNGCTGSEQYVVFDPEAMALDVRREAIQIAWYTTGGTFGDDTSGRSAGEAGSATLNAPCAAGTECIDNTWTVPTTAGEVLLWVVIRDDRGGVGWQSYRVEVE